MSINSTGLAAHPALVDAETKLASLNQHLRLIIDCDGQWECDRNGRIVWSEGEPVAPLGELLGRFDSEDFALAFERRAPFRDLDNGLGWQLTAVPYFESGTGRFLGFRGRANRRMPVRRSRDLFGTGASADAFANMAHEARTPLSAIMGFAQMIEAETLGAAGQHYRQGAGAIVQSATRLLDAVDDLASAAQLEQGRYPVVEGTTDVAAVIVSLLERYAPLAARRSVRMSAHVAIDLPLAAVDERLLSRALDRIASTLLAVADDETLALAAQPVGGTIELVVSRPYALAGLSAETLVDPASSVLERGAAAPVLGLGFGLRLAAGLIEATGGSLAIEAERLRIVIPGIAKRARSA